MTPQPERTEELLKYLADKPVSFLEILPEEIATEWLLIVDKSGASFQPRFLEELRMKCRGFVDFEKGGLSKEGEKHFSNTFPSKFQTLIQAAAHHRNLTRQQTDSRVHDSLHLVPLDLLVESPLSAQLYDTRPDEDETLALDIEQHGQLVPIVINRTNGILSGNRRLRALKLLGRPNALVVDADVAPQDEIEWILSYNLKRHLSNVEKLRVFARYLEIEKGRAAIRQQMGRDLPENSPEGCRGEAREIAAKRVGLSGRTAEMGLRVLREIEARNTGVIEEVAEVTKALNTSILAGHKAALRYGWFATPPMKRKASKSPAEGLLAQAISSAATTLQDNPVALRLMKSSAMHQTLNTHDNIRRVHALRRYAQALLTLADQLEKQQ